MEKIEGRGQDKGRELNIDIGWSSLGTLRDGITGPSRLGRRLAVWNFRGTNPYQHHRRINDQSQETNHPLASTPLKMIAGERLNRPHDWPCRFDFQIACAKFVWARVREWATSKTALRSTGYVCGTKSYMSTPVLEVLQFLQADMALTVSYSTFILREFR